MENPEEDTYKKFYEQGTFIHTAILEPKKLKDNLFVLPEEFTDFRTKVAKELRDEALSMNKNVLLYKDYVQTMQMVEAYRSNKLLQKYVTGGEAELSMFWVDEETGIRCKCRPDYLNLEEGYIIDVKSTGEIDKFQKSVFNYNYHVQAAHYLNGLSAVLGKEITKFYLLALGKEPPYDVELFVFDIDTIEEGREACSKGLSILRECLDTDSFPNKYGQELRIIQKPNWRKENDTNNEEIDCGSNV